MENKNETYDAIMIGSGMGALSAAAVLARVKNKRILILERHFKAGGFTHTFKRKKFQWDVGIHYIGNMGPGTGLRRVFDFITGDGVRWNKMPDPFEKFVYPDFTFEVNSGAENYMRGLLAMFPAEEKALETYFRDIERTRKWFESNEAAELMPAPVAAVARLLNRRRASLTSLSTGEYLDRTFRDPKLKALLASQWGDYGLPPARSSFVIHSIIVSHYLNGGYYPEGGAGVIAAKILPAVERAGGRALLGREVTEILVEDGRAAGVRTRKAPRGEEEIFRAPVVISCAGAYTTYLNLLPAAHAAPFTKELRAFREDNAVTTTACLYIGFKSDPRVLGFQGENHWIYNSYDHDASAKSTSGLLAAGGEPGGVYLSFPSLKDGNTAAHTADIITFIDYEHFLAWKDQPWKNRDAEYREMKERIADNLIRFLDRRYPGFADLVEYKELSTPLSNEFFTGHHRGMIYGVPAIPGRFGPNRPDWTRTRSHLPGLYLTGVDVTSLGIAGAMMGGFKTAMTLLDGRERMRLLRRLRP